MATIKTLADVLSTAQVAGASFIAATGRGNGSAEFSICVDEAREYEDEAVEAVTAEEDPEAWRLARAALQSEPTGGVWVGSRGTGSNPHQAIYAY